MTGKAQPGKRKMRWLPALCVVLVLALAVLFIWTRRITTITVTGMDFYTGQEVADSIFETPLERNFFYAWINNRLGKKKSIPFVAGYTLTFNGMSEVQVTVYEKNIIGYVDYMGNHMYFDKDGTIVESSSEVVWEGVPQITGLTFDHIVLYQTLPVEDPSAFTLVLNLSQLVKRYDCAVDKIHFDSNLDITLYMGGIRVILGNMENLEDKVAEAASMLPKLAGYAGELHLEDYDSTALNPSYTFIKD